MQNEFVSIIIPTYQRARSIMDSVNSILNQTYSNFELLIIDDGSTDNTKELIESINDKRIKYHQTPSNMGAAAARNYGLKLAEYDYIAFHDSDDTWHPNKLEKQMQLIQENPNYGMVYCKMELINLDRKANATSIPSFMPKNETDVTILQGNIFNKLLKENFIGIPTILIKKECFDEIGLLDDSYKALEDWELMLRIAQSYEIGYINEPLYTYYINNSDCISGNIGAYFEARLKLVQKYKNEMIETGTLNSILEDILMKANAVGTLESVGKLMEMYLQ